MLLKREELDRYGAHVVTTMSSPAWKVADQSVTTLANTFAHIRLWQPEHGGCGSFDRDIRKKVPFAEGIGIVATRERFSEG